MVSRAAGLNKWGRRGSVDFIGLRSSILGALFCGRFLGILFVACDHLGDLLGVDSAKMQLRRILVLPHVSGVPKWFLCSRL
jgi:hypothetical protein